MHPPTPATGKLIHNLLCEKNFKTHARHWARDCLKSLCGGGVPSSHPSLACPFSFFVGTGLARTGLPKKNFGRAATATAGSASWAGMPRAHYPRTKEDVDADEEAELTRLESGLPDASALEQQQDHPALRRSSRRASADEEQQHEDAGDGEGRVDDLAAWRMAAELLEDAKTEQEALFSLMKKFSLEALRGCCERLGLCVKEGKSVLAGRLLVARSMDPPLDEDAAPRLAVRKEIDAGVTKLLRGLAGGGGSAGSGARVPQRSRLTRTLSPDAHSLVW